MGSAIMKPLKKRRGRSRTVLKKIQGSNDTQAQVDGHAIGDGNIGQFTDKSVLEAANFMKVSENVDVTDNKRSSDNLKNFFSVGSDEEPLPVQAVYNSYADKSDENKNLTSELTGQPHITQSKTSQAKENSIAPDVDLDLKSSLNISDGHANKGSKEQFQSKVQQLKSPPNTSAINDMYGPANPANVKRPKSVSARSNTARSQTLKSATSSGEADGTTVEDIDMPEKSADAVSSERGSDSASCVDDTEDIDLSQDARTDSPKFDDLEDVKVINPSEIKGSGPHEGSDIIRMCQPIPCANLGGAGDVSIGTSDQPAPEKNNEQVTEVDHVIFINASASREKARDAKTEPWERGQNVTSNGLGGEQRKNDADSDTNSTEEKTKQAELSQGSGEQSGALQTKEQEVKDSRVTSSNARKYTKPDNDKQAETIDVFQAGAEFIESAYKPPIYSIDSSITPSHALPRTLDESANNQTQRHAYNQQSSQLSMKLQESEQYSPQTIKVLPKLEGECLDRKLPPLGRPPGGISRDLSAPPVPPLGSIVPSQSKEAVPLSKNESLNNDDKMPCVSQSLQKPVSRPSSSKVNINSPSENAEIDQANSPERMSDSRQSSDTCITESAEPPCRRKNEIGCPVDKSSKEKGDQAKISPYLGDPDLRPANERVNPEIVGCVQRQLFEEGLKPSMRDGGVSFFIPITEDGLQPATQHIDISERLTKGKKASLNYEEKMMLANLNRQSHLSKLKEFAVRDLLNVRQNHTGASSSESSSMGSDGCNKPEQDEHGATENQYDF